MRDVGVIHGRFQILHNDHLKYILAGAAGCEHLVVGITNPDPSLTRADPANPERSNAAANPLTYFQRYLMMKAALVEAGMSHTRFSVVPFPINRPKLWRYYVPLDAMFFLTIYDDWGRRKLDMFNSMNLETEILWERPLQRKGITATQVRERILRGEPWDELVPASTYRLLNEWGIDRLLKGLMRTAEVRP